MASKSTLSFFYFLLFSFMHFSSTVFSWTNHASTCNGSIAECNQEDELLMESEISRRFLEERRYISPGALKRDKPVCNGGASGEAYSKSGGCLPPPSNPYNRGCSKYYRCRSDS
ncbi:protein RALF-like 32 [Lotus japonicus]|uniref:Rapid ALkalinization Factor n=1 Tax=Lotus japonicus TaxID=34305 RepID=I3RZ93_LOTJA|nr:protein RALF-like 32 [Lotus japonicus]AFK33335.1 unknown [Lotus japonicus]